MAIGGTGFTDRKMHREMPRKELAFVPDDRRGRRICSGREILLDGERPVGCALLCSKSLRQRLAASKSEAFEGIPNVSRSACIAAGVPSAIKMRSMKCPHRIFRRDYLVVRERARSADNRIVGQPLKPFAIVRAIAVVRAFSIFGRGREG